MPKRGVRRSVFGFEFEAGCAEHVRNTCGSGWGISSHNSLNMPAIAGVSEIKRDQIHKRPP